MDSVTQVKTNTADDTLRALTKGSKQIVVAENLLNLQSSRSHTIFTITLDRKDNIGYIDSVQSQLQFVDLAGSERFSYFKDTSKQHVKEWYSGNKPLN